MQKVFTKRSAKGFSLVELLAVVLILAVLAAVAVPLYLNTRKTSAARACKANLNAIASAEAAVALREGHYATLATLATTSPEGLSAVVACPLDNTAYKLTSTADGTGTAITDTTNTAFYITCPKFADHVLALSGGGGNAAWQRPMSAIGTDSSP